MNLKTFRAHSMAECLTEVKKDLGKDAVILRTRSYRVGGMLGLGGRSMIEITASSDPVPNGFRPAPRLARPGAARSNQSALQPRHAAASTVGPAPSNRLQPANELDTVVAAAPKLADYLAGAHRDARAQETARGQRVRNQNPIEDPVFGDRATAIHDGPRSTLPGRSTTFEHAALDSVTDNQSQASRGLASGFESIHRSASQREAVAGLVTRVDVRPQTSEASEALQEELASIKRMVGQVLRVSRKTHASAVVDFGGMPEHLFTMFRTLTDQGLEPELVDRVLAETRDELDAAELADASTVESTVVHRLAALIPTSPTDQLGEARVMTLVGPTGVGKTTTLAKLAATLKLRHNRRVGLVTCDTYRIAAVEQLRVYANIIGLDMKVAMSPQEAGRHVQSLSECDVVLVDTAGRSPHDDGRLEELREFVDAVESDETHLVLSLASAEGVMTRAAERFRGLRPSRLLMTKLDEAVAFGPIVNIARQLSLPIGYVTTGQEVPDQFERGDSLRLAKTVLRGGGDW